VVVSFFKKSRFQDLIEDFELDNSSTYSSTM
jgi:hypothetical protein